MGQNQNLFCVFETPCSLPCCGSNGDAYSQSNLYYGISKYIYVNLKMYWKSSMYFKYYGHDIFYNSTL